MKLLKIVNTGIVGNNNKIYILLSLSSPDGSSITTPEAKTDIAYKYQPQNRSDYLSKLFSWNLSSKKEKTGKKPLETN